MNSLKKLFDGCEVNSQCKPGHLYIINPQFMKVTPTSPLFRVSEAKKTEGGAKFEITVKAKIDKKFAYGVVTGMNL